MDSTTKGILTIAGIAAITALGVAAGSAAHHDRRPRQLLHRGKQKFEDLTEGDVLPTLFDRVADALHLGDGERRLHRGRRDLADLADWKQVSAFLDDMVDSLPKSEADRLVQRVRSRLRH